MSWEIDYVDDATEVYATDNPADSEQAAAAKIVNGDGMDGGDTGSGDTDSSDLDVITAADLGDDNQPEAEADPATLAAEDVAREKHDLEISTAKEEHFSLAVRRSELENELKEIKAEEKAALKYLKNLIRRGPVVPEPESKIDQAVAAADNPMASHVDDPNADMTWRQTPTSALLEGIKGLGTKKAEAIIDLAPTFGDLEDLRGKAGLAHKSFASCLPRGIGSNMADAIEDRIVEFGTKYQIVEKQPEAVEGTENNVPE